MTLRIPSTTTRSAAVGGRIIPASNFTLTSALELLSKTPVTTGPEGVRTPGQVSSTNEFHLRDQTRLRELPTGYIG